MNPIIAFDVGTSGSKVVAGYQQISYPCKCVERHWLIEPYVSPLTHRSYRSWIEECESHSLYSNVVSFVDPVSGERTYWEVGGSAARPGKLLTHARKFENSLVKILSLLGYMALREFGHEEPKAIALGILLPFDELDDRRLLSQWIRDSIKTLEFNGIAIRELSISSLSIQPEGFGVHKEYQASRVLIMGHSDTSLLSFRDNKLITSETYTFPESGFHDFLSLIKFPLNYELRAAEIIVKAGRNLNPKVLSELTQTRGEAELLLLIEAIAEARRQYWIARSEQLSALNYEGLKHLPVTGGNANFFNQELVALYRGLGIRMNWCKPLMVEFFDRFNLEKKSPLLHRFADCYGFYKQLPGVDEFELAIAEVV